MGGVETTTPSWRVGIDTGGTFTDVVAASNGEVRRAKVPSTPPNFDDGVLAAIGAVGLAPAEVLVLAHGTTVTTNAVITKTGARTGLITTQGFRDVLELRRHNRAELYDILWDPPEPLVPRRRRLEIRERVDYAGTVVQELDELELEEVLERLHDHEIESLAVCFLHSYENPAHELRVKEIVSERWPELYVSISSDLLREPQEFERTSTTAVNSYVGPILARYVDRLERRLGENGFRGRLLLMHSGGGLLPASSIVAVPARTLTSGPAAGAMAAQRFSSSGSPAAGAMAAEKLAETTGFRQIISLDIGGTSADIAVVRDGRTLLVNEYSPEFGMPIRFPAVDLMTIGAGGGSIAWVDVAGTPRVGPQSAGAVPGPACYDLGGTEATVTDANLVLGRLSPTTRLAGAVELHLGPAEEAVERFAAAIGMERDEAALGIVGIANSNMARAVRVMTVERGLDPREFVLLPFGGAGPMHACELADELGIRRVLVPIAPGVTSALGTLFVDVVHDLARSHIVPLSAVDPDAVEDAFGILEARAQAALDEDLVPRGRQQLERSLDFRYLGQLKTLPITVPSTPFDAATIAAARHAFLAEYERRYQYVTEDIEVELSVVRVRGRGVQERPELPVRPPLEAPRPYEERPVRFRDGPRTTPVYWRDDLGRGLELPSPLVVEQLDTTTVVPPDWALSVDPQGNLLLERARP
jgi:N-methylhydantoinase A